MPIINLSELVNRITNPVPWEDVKYNFPWNDPDFSKRMLKEHLDESHDLASRSPGVMNRQLDWIETTWFEPREVKTVLDLTCGPGLIANELARRGYTVRGFDVAPAAIDYARKTATREALPAIFNERDIRAIGYDAGYDAAIFNYGMPNSFNKEEFSLILNRTRDALDPGGFVILEFNSLNSIKNKTGREWRTVSENGLFGERPYLWLQENFYHEEHKTAAVIHYIIDLENAGVRTYSICYQGYTRDDLEPILNSCGLKIVAEFDSLTGETGLDDPVNMVVIAERIESEGE